MGWPRQLVGRLDRGLRRALSPGHLRLYAPALVFVAYLPFLRSLLRTELNEPLFGDQLVFQYTGWCIRHGLRLYRDVGMADGPFIHFLHAGISLFVGFTDLHFHWADICLEASGGVLMGILLAPRGITWRLSWAAGASWGLFACALWLSAYLTLEWTVVGERETFYALFGSVGLIAIYAADDIAPRPAFWLTVAGAFLCTLQFFGKPTGIVYPCAGAVILFASDRAGGGGRRSRWRAFLYGAGAAVLSLALLLTLFGSFRDYYFWSFLIPYRGNKFLVAVDWHRLLLITWDEARIAVVVSTVAALGAMGWGLLPRKAIGLVVTGPLLYAGAILQARGYPYQVWPSIAASNVLCFVIVSALWGDGFRRDRRRRVWRPLYRVAAFLGLATFTYQCFSDYQHSPYRWNGKAEGLDAPVHTFAVTEKAVGEYLRANTAPTDRVFAYVTTQNAHVILLTAQRRTASPFFHDFWLDPIGMLTGSEVKPDPAARAALENLQSEIRARACHAVESSVPRAMVFNDEAHVYQVCPDLRALVEARYHVATTIGGFVVHMRNES